jgi:hypothetical protein
VSPPVVTVTDARIVVSRSTVATGTTVLTVLNRSSGSRRVRVAGAVTRLMKPGTRATLRVTFTAGGRYAVVASGGKKPLTATLRAVVSVPTGTLAPPPPPPPASSQAGSSCAKPVATTVAVALGDGQFTFSPSVVPCGTITFVLTNVGTVNHSLYLESAGAQSGGLAPGQSEKLTVNLSPGGIPYLDGVYEVDLGGAVGTLPVSG